jgi:hypothetical protein
MRIYHPLPRAPANSYRIFKWDRGPKSASESQAITNSTRCCRAIRWYCSVDAVRPSDADISRCRELPRTSYRSFSGPRGPKSYLTVRRSAIVPDAVKPSDAVRASGSSSPGAEASNDSAQPRRGSPATVCLMASVENANRQQHQMVLCSGSFGRVYSISSHSPAPTIFL